MEDRIDDFIINDRLLPDVNVPSRQTGKRPKPGLWLGWQTGRQRPTTKNFYKVFFRSEFFDWSQKRETSNVNDFNDNDNDYGDNNNFDCDVNDCHNNNLDNDYGDSDYDNDN